MNEIYRDLRPVEFDHVIGQDAAVSVLKSKLGGRILPHVVLLHGPSGSGKTSLARIIATKLGCTPSNMVEQNCAEVRGIDSVRDISEVMSYAPLGGSCRVWLLDEVVQLPKTTQQAFLTVLENPPEHVWFLLCTTDMVGLLDTFRSRCFQIHLQPLSDASMERILERAVREMRAVTTPLVIQEIVARSEGNARKALQILDVVLTTQDPREQMNLLGDPVRERCEFLALAILNRKGWPAVVTSMGGVEDKDLESLRRGMLAYAAKVLCGGNSKLHPRAYAILLAFEEPWTWTGRAGMVKAAYQCCTQ